MITMKKEIARYQVFIAGDIQCVQDSIGYWRTVSKNDSGKWEIRISKSRPAIFKEFRMLTREQMEWDAFSQGYPIFYVPDRTVADALTFQEAADIFREQMTDLNELGKVGLKLKCPRIDRQYELEIPLKVFDYVAPEQLPRTEFKNQLTHPEFLERTNG